MGHNLGLDYATYAKRGFGLGVVLFVLGSVLGAVGPVLVGELPSWEQTVLVDLMLLGIGVGFCSVFGFGIFLPLID